MQKLLYMALLVVGVYADNLSEYKKMTPEQFKLAKEQKILDIVEHQSICADAYRAKQKLLKQKEACLRIAKNGEAIIACEKDPGDEELNKAISKERMLEAKNGVVNMGKKAGELLQSFTK